MSGAQTPIRESEADLRHIQWKPPWPPDIDVDIDRVIGPLLDLELPEEDGIPMETNWHRSAMNLLIDSVHALWHDRDNYFAGGNMFIYYSLEQVRNKEFLGPDFFVVKDVDGAKERRTWTVWRENGRYPDVIVELSSPSTINADFTSKKAIYERIFHTMEYFCYDPDARHLHGWKYTGHAYAALEADEMGRLWSDELQAWIGLWEGEFQRIRDVWPRLYTPDHDLVLTLAEAEAKRAEAEAERANRAEAENARLKALLAEHGIVPEQGD